VWSVGRARAACLAGILALAGCAGSPPVPDWASNAHGGLARYEAAWLRGDTRVAQAEFTRARAELARTGRPELVAHAELVRCAMRTASLDFDDCPGFQPLAQDAGAAARAYADYLAGRWQAIDATLLPPQHRPVIAGAAGLQAIEEPASRLVAAGVLLRTGQIEPAGIALAVDTASGQGWRRALLAWLAVQQQRARAAGDAEAAAGIGRRMDLIAH
jgi:hypothetical protein